MDNFDLIRFMQDLVSKPGELRKYKQDPATYLKQSHPHLDQGMHELLTNFSAHPRWGEISTVFQIQVNPGRASATASPLNPAPKIISLCNMEVQIFAPGSSIIIEKTEEYYPLQFRLLSHSYIVVDDQNQVYFKLHPYYVRPHDHTDRPFVFEITSPQQVDPPHYNLIDAPIELTVSQAMVLPYNQSFKRRLQEGSQYNRATGQITLVFDTTHLDTNPG